jgi:pimeloyl-ACP methyl ester carboxylesterase
MRLPGEISPFPSLARGEGLPRGHETWRMGFLSEIRHPTTWHTQFAIAVLALAFFAFLATAAGSGFLVYRMINPERSHPDVNLNLANFPGHPEKLVYSAAGSQRDGWFFPGRKSAPTIVLCPGYESSRGELLTMASSLQDQQFNVLLFDFSAQGDNAGRSTLGFQEVGELRVAMDAVAKRGDVDVDHFGLWGTNMGAYVALAEAINDHRVRAIAADSPYPHPNDMVALQVSRAGLGSAPFVTRMSKSIFDWVNEPYRNTLPLTGQIVKLAGVAQLYLESPDDPRLAATTSALFRNSMPPHELADLPHGNYAGMADEEKRAYENRIVSFFLLNLPSNP